MKHIKKTEVGGQRSEVRWKRWLIAIALLFAILHPPSSILAENVNVTDHQLKTTKPVPVTVVGSQTLPSGAATAAKQDTGNTSAATTATNTTIPTLTRFRDTGLTSTAVAVKASGGNVHGWNFINLNTVPVYVKFYNIAAGSVTVGTSAVSVTIAIPASGAFFVRSEMVPQQTFSTAIAIAAVTGIADNSTAAPATAIHASVQYQ